MLFNNNYSLIITKGLGGPRCCALITAQFGLVCGCKIEVVLPGGGGPYPGSEMLYTPTTTKLNRSTALVIVTVKIKEHTFRKQYVIDREKAEIMVSVREFVNVIKEKIQLKVDNIKEVTKKVIVKLFDK